MTTTPDRRLPQHPPAVDGGGAPTPDQSPPEPHNAPHGGHVLMMIACCIPMLLIAGILFATGVAGAGVILAAVMCTAMMAMMMVGMNHGDDDRR